MLAAVLYHSDHLELSEQFDRDSGYEKSVRNLTWSYAAFLSAVRKVAATYLASKEPKPSDANQGGGDFDSHYWNHDRTQNWKDIFADPEGYARRDILQAARNETSRNRAA